MQIRCIRRFIGLKEFRWTKVIQFVNYMIPLFMWNIWHWFLWNYTIKDGRFLPIEDFHCNWTSFINASNSSVWPSWPTPQGHILDNRRYMLPVDSKLPKRRLGMISLSIFIFILSSAKCTTEDNNLIGRGVPGIFKVFT